MPKPKTTRTPVFAITMPQVERDPIQEMARSEDRSESSMGRILLREAMAARATATEENLNQKNA